MGISYTDLGPAAAARKVAARRCPLGARCWKWPAICRHAVPLPSGISPSPASPGGRGLPRP